MKYQIHPMIRTTYVDGANPAFIKSLKLQLVEETGYDTVIARYILEGLVDSSSQDIRMDLPNCNCSALVFVLSSDFSFVNITLFRFLALFVQNGWMYGHMIFRCPKIPLGL